MYTLIKKIIVIRNEGTYVIRFSFYNETWLFLCTMGMGAFLKSFGFSFINL